MVAIVQRGSSPDKGYDLSARQLAIFLICYQKEGPHTVRGLAAELGISRPAVSRALDRLGDFGLTRRQMDPRDRRSIIVRRTRKGTERLTELKDLSAQVAKEVSGTGTPESPAVQQ